jgi:UDP-glucose 4-epimerase
MYHLTTSERPAFLQDSGLREKYQGKRALVLGGDGFMGVHLATALQMLGADVSILSRRNTSLLESVGVTIYRGHLLQDAVLKEAITEKDIVFDLAGSSGALTSNQDARRNFVSECEPHLAAYQFASELPKPPLMVFCSSRTVYGKPTKLPVSEAHPLAPISVYAIHKLTLENYLQNFHRTRGLNFLIFRLSNPYGPYLWQEKKDYGVINQFILNAFSKRPIRLFGDGSQLRDYVFIDDVIEVFLRASAEPSTWQEVFNLGGPAPISMKAAVEVLTSQRPGSPVRLEAWPKDYHAIETGDYVTDNSKLLRALPGLNLTSFREGVRRTFANYDKLLAPDEGSANVEVSLALGHVKRRSLEPRKENWEGRRVLVSGANGFIGGQLVLKLLEHGAIVSTINRNALSPDLPSHSRLMPLQIDLGDARPAFRDAELFKPEVIFHMASRPDAMEANDHAAQCIEVNLRGTVHLLELARRVSSAAFVFADTAKVYGNSPVPHRENSLLDPCSSYGVSKMSAWHYCRLFSKLHGVNVVALRPTLVYGRGQKNNLFSFLAQKLAAGASEIQLAGGNQTRDPIYIDDALNAYLRAAEMARRLNGRAIPIGGGAERTVKEIAEAFVKQAGYSTGIKCCQEAVRPTEMMRSYCDNVDAWEALRWQPEIALSDGLRWTAEYLFKTLTSKAHPPSLVAKASKMA